MTRYIHRHTDLSIPAKGAWLSGLLSHVPEAQVLLICFAAAPIASRTSREFVFANVFQKAGYASLLLEGLTGYEEKRDPDSRFDVPRLADRLVAAFEWISHQPQLAQLTLAISATGTAAAAMIKASGAEASGLFALVSRSGRLDLAGAAPLKRNRVPLLAITGGADDATRGPATQAYALIDGPKAWHEVDNASEAFIEPGAMDAAAKASLQWVERWRPATLDIADTG